MQALLLQTCVHCNGADCSSLPGRRNFCSGGQLKCFSSDMHRSQGVNLPHILFCSSIIYRSMSRRSTQGYESLFLGSIIICAHASSCGSFVNLQMPVHCTCMGVSCLRMPSLGKCCSCKSLQTAFICLTACCRPAACLAANLAAHECAWQCAAGGTTCGFGAGAKSVRMHRHSGCHSSSKPHAGLPCLLPASHQRDL